jgi:hypothetical protein
LNGGCKLQDIGAYRKQGLPLTDENKKGLHRNAAPFKIQYPMKNRIRKYCLTAVFKAAFDERTDLFDKRMFFGD